MNEAATIELFQTDANEQIRKRSIKATDEKPTNNETLHDMLDPNLAHEVSDDDLHEHIHSNLPGKGYANNFLNGRIDGTEVIERTTDESTVPSLVNSSFDTTESHVSPSINHTASSKTIDCTNLEEIKTRHISNIQSGDNEDIFVFDATSNSTKVVDAKNDIKNSSQLMTLEKNISDPVLLFDVNTTLGTEVADGLQGFFTSNDTSPINDIDTMYAEACNRVSATQDSYNYTRHIASSPPQQPKIDDDHSESLTGSYFSCRDEASFNDNINSDVSFHTALCNQGSITSNSTAISGRHIDENRSQHLHGFRDFLSCRSGEETSSQIYDLSSSRVDDQQSEQDNSLLSYYTCRKFNQQGLISILKKGGNDNDCTPGKKFNVPLDILIREGIESSTFVKSTRKYQQILRNKHICYVGLFVLIILVITVGAVLTLNQNSHATNEKAKRSVPDNTNGLTTQAPTNFPTPAPSHRPTIMITDIVVTMYPSMPPSVQPSTSRHRDNIFLRPPKKRTPSVKVKVNSTLV